MGLREWLGLSSRKEINFSTSVQIRSIPTREEIKRVDFSKLEQVYHVDGLVFNIINRYRQFVSAPIYFEAESPRVKNFFTNYAREIRLQELIPEIVGHLCIYGNCYLEKVWNQAGTKIVGLVLIDPKTIDVKKDSNEVPILDETGKPAFYVQEVPSLAKKVEFKRDEIVHLRLFTTADSYKGIGLIEPVYKAVIIKLNLEESLGENIHRHGFPILHTRIGDPNRPETFPSAKEIEAWSAEIKNLNALSSITTPYFYDVKFLQPEPLGELADLLNYYSELISAGMGCPSSLALGQIRGARAALETQQQFFEKMVATIQLKISQGLEDQFFSQVAKLNGFKEVPKMRFEIFTSESLDAKIERWTKLVSSGLVVPDEVLESYIRELEHLPKKKLEMSLPYAYEEISKQLYEDLVKIYGDMRRKTLKKLEETLQ